MNWFLWVLAVLAVLALLFLGICGFIGHKFLRNLKRKNPGDKFKADIDVSFYQNSPHKIAAEKGLKLMDTLAHEDVYLTSRDGLKLHATLFPAPEPGKRFVLGIHGFQSKAWHEFAPYIAFYHSLGFSMLLPDDRAHGLSEGKYITMGVKDRLDCVDWAKYLVQQYGEDCRILFHGVSMGGATVISASAEEDLPPQVFGTVSDCGYTSVEDQLDFQLKSLFHIPPAFPKAVCRWFARHVAGFDIHEAQPIDRIRKCRVPILIVQGTEDFLVPKEMAYQLCSACTAKKRMLMVRHASHAESIAVEPESYHKAIREFFEI